MAVSPIDLRGMFPLPSVTSRNPGRSRAVLEAPAIVAGLYDVAMMRETVEQGHCHLRIAEHARPLAKGEIGGHDHRGPLVEAADQMEQKLSASLGERQIAEFIEDDEVEAREIIGEARLAARPSFGLEPIDKIDSVEEPATRSGADATARDRHRQMRLAGASPANQDDVALLRDEAAAGESAHQALVDRCTFEFEAIDILGQWQFGDGFEFKGTPINESLV